MAKVQGKKTAAGARKRPGKKAPRPPHAKAASRKQAKKTISVPKKKAGKPPKPVARPTARVGKASKATIVHPEARKHPPKRVASVPRPVAAPEKKRSRRSRPRVHSTGVAVAAWFAQGEKPRPSSFIPAPPRAEGPSLIASAPASSDRLVSTHELTEFAVRTVPVRIDVEAGAGRVFLAINPEEVTLRVGEGIEWDFRYVGGADVVVDELIIEFEKPLPFRHATFRSRRPGTARPHRQLSGPAQKSAAGKRARYTVRAINAFKAEVAVARPWVTIAG